MPGKLLGLLLKTAPRRKRSAAVIHEIPVHQDFAVQETPKRLRRASDGSHPLPLLVGTFVPPQKPSMAAIASAAAWPAPAADFGIAMGHSLRILQDTEQESKHIPDCLSDIQKQNSVSVMLLLTKNLIHQ